MSLSQRPLQNESDKALLLALAQKYRSETLHDIDLPYRLCSWGLDELQNTQLWFDETGQLVGWAIMQTPFWTIDYQFAPQLVAELHPKILAWADTRAKAIIDEPSGHDLWFAMAFTRQIARIKDLEALGFKSQTHAEYPRAKALLRHTQPLASEMKPLPEGFTIRPLAGRAEAPAYVELHRAAFDTKNMTKPWRARTLQHPLYRPDLDLVVTASNGRLAAFCIAWLDHDAKGTPIGRIEPLGVHPDFRKLGLGRAALVEAMRRLQTLGVNTIYVESDKTEGSTFNFYQSLGFELVEEVEVFGKNYREEVFV
jgi:mycothiol synthase